MADNTKLIHGITRQILSCRHECQLDVVKNFIDKCALPDEAKKVLYEHCKVKAEGLPKIAVYAPRFNWGFSRTAGLNLK